MAFRVLPFYNIESPVGAGKPNKVTDVLLVRHFLRLILGPLPAGRTWVKLRTGKDIELKPLPAEGGADENLTGWIYLFQVKFSSGSDAVVDPITTQGLTSSLLTLAKMNGMANGILMDKFPFLHLDPSVPAALRAALLANYR